tara:strand:- start:1 stop:246 length:246 start_codon:yes stop_codon:yes gene_type:complete
MATDKESVKSMIDIMVDYRKGLLNLDSALKALDYATDLGPDICEKMLKNSKRDNVTQLRGYSKEPEHLLKSKKGKPNEAKK